MLFFNVVSPYMAHGAIYPSQHFPFGAAFVCQAGTFGPILVNVNCRIIVQ